MLGGHHGGGHHGSGRSNHGGSSSHHASSNGLNSLPPYRSGQPLPASASTAACPKCRAFGAPGDHFCQQCGTALVPLACGTCRSEVPIGARFCQQCGTPVTALG
ncbi:double zinc ribbon domain-containing protein [Paraburkholderia phenazinium]|nr:zinc ribbon domain-containing protein [Paraburkholderia phenazinium]